MENIESCSPRTLKAYSSDLDQAFRDKLNVVFSESEAWACARLATQLWGGLSPASRNRKVATLKSLFNWLLQQGHIEQDLAEQLHCPKIPKRIPHFISVDEVLSVLKYFSEQLSENSDSDSADKIRTQKTLFVLLYGCGLRISEACTLKWKDVDLAQSRILINGKGGKQRYAVMPSLCCEYLSKFQGNRKTEFVFGDAPLNPRTGYELIRMAGAAAGLMTPLHPHALRHSYATHLLASGTNLRTLQNLLGHESLQATEKYTHLSVDQLARLVERTHPLNKLKLSS